MIESNPRIEIVRAAGVRDEWASQAADFYRYHDTKDEAENARVTDALRRNAGYMFYRPGEQPAKRKRR